ncbi:MAG TPA: glycosyltransferase [Acidobacteriaceae bacterium]
MAPQPSRRKILYVGSLGAGHTSLHRFDALARLGQEMVPFALEPHEPQSRYVAALQYRLPVGPLIRKVNEALQAAIAEHRPDVVWFDKPVLFHAGTLEAAKRAGAQTVCYLLDNPFGPRHDGNWMQFLKVYKLFDLHCLVRSVDVGRYSGWGLPFVKIMLSYDPQTHFPPAPGWGDADRRRELAYTGSPLEKRAAFLQSLGEACGLPLSVAGPRWEKAWPPELLQKYVVGGMMKDAAYRASLWTSKINLAFMTRMNEEDVAHKAFEITACAQFLLAERSPGHQACFEEGREAEFFGSLEECADKARFYLAHPAEREAIAAAGRARSLRSGYDNDAQLARVLDRLDGVGPESSAEGAAAHDEGGRA